MSLATPETDNGIDLQIKCLKPEAASFSIDSSKFTLTFPENCGLGLINTFVEKSYTDSSKTLFCAECQSGFKKIVDANNVVTQCKVIPNCDPNRTGHWFNNCFKCLNTHAWHWSSNTGTLYDECVVRTIPNCEVVYNNGQI
jgi:hypothetical protein